MVRNEDILSDDVGVEENDDVYGDNDNISDKDDKKPTMARTTTVKTTMSKTKTKNKPCIIRMFLTILK